MTTPQISFNAKNESFLLEDLLEQPCRETALERAAQITPLVKSVTLGPNSTYLEPVRSDEGPSTITISIKNTPENGKVPKRVVSIKNTSPVTPNDIRELRQKMQKESKEKRLKDQVRKQMEQRLEKEREHYDKIQRQLEAMKLEAERKHRAKVEALERQIEAALKLEAQEEVLYQKDRSELTKNTRKIIEQQEKEHKENLRRHNEHFDKMAVKFNETLDACKLEPNTTTDFKNQLESLGTQRNGCRSSLDGLKRMCMKLDELHKNLIKVTKDFEVKSKAIQAQKDAEAAAKAQAAKELAEAQAQAAGAAQKNAQAPVQQQQQIYRSVPVNNESGRSYHDLMQLLNDKQNSTKQLSESQDLQALRFALKMAVNRPINLLNEENRTSLIEGFQQLSNLLLGQRIQTDKGAVSVADHPEASDWTKLRLAEKLIDVCDKKPIAIFYVASLSLALWQKFPDFGQILTAKLFKECPFLIPHKPSQLKNQSDEEFLKSWGYRVSEGVNEKYEHYQLRTSRLAHFLAAIWITFPRRGEQTPHPFNISNGWKFLVNVMNLPTEPMYLHLIDKILEISGSTLQATFGKQFVKLMMVLNQQYLPSVEQHVDEEMRAAFDRLRNTVMKFFKENRFDPPKGKMNLNFW